MKISQDVKKQYNEAKHHTHYIVKPQAQENNFIIKDINYTPTNFIKIYSSQNNSRMMHHITCEFSEI